MERIGAAVIGLGGMGLGDAGTLLKRGAEYVHTVKGFDISPDARRRAQEMHGIEVYDDIKNLWADPTIQVVYICTSNASHVPLSIDALKAGKAVMCEKPFGCTREETEALVRTVRETDGWFQGGFECRNYSRLYKEIKDIIDSGEIGELRHMQHTYVLQPWSNASSWRKSMKESGGLFCEKLCHYVDLPRWWDGTPIQEFFIAKAPNILPGEFELIDNCELTYRFQSGCVSHLTFMMGAAACHELDVTEKQAARMPRTDEFFVFRYIFVGTEGGITASLWHRDLIVFHHAGKPGMDRPARMTRMRCWDKKDDWREFHNTPDQNVDIARRVANGLPPAVDVEDVARTMHFCYACEEAVQQPWAVHAFEPPQR